MFVQVQALQQRVPGPRFQVPTCLILGSQKGKLLLVMKREAEVEGGMCWLIKRRLSHQHQVLGPCPQTRRRGPDGQARALGAAVPGVWPDPWTLQLAVRTGLCWLAWLVSVFCCEITWACWPGGRALWWHQAWCPHLRLLPGYHDLPVRWQNKHRLNPRAMPFLCGLKKKKANAHDEQLSDLGWEACEWCTQVGSPSPVEGGRRQPQGRTGQRASCYLSALVAECVQSTRMQGGLAVRPSVFSSQCLLGFPDREIWKLPGPRGGLGPHVCRTSLFPEPHSWFLLIPSWGGSPVWDWVKAQGPDCPGGDTCARGRPGSQALQQQLVGQGGPDHRAIKQGPEGSPTSLREPKSPWRERQKPCWPLMSCAGVWGIFMSHLQLRAPRLGWDLKLYRV